MTAGLRQTVYELITADQEVTDMVPAVRWYERGAVEDSPTKPFAVLVWLTTVPASGGRYLHPLEVWVHDNRGDYSLIEATLQEVKRVLSGATQYAGTNGVRLVQADFTGQSGDLDDPDRGTNVKNSSWLVVGG